MRCIWGKVRPAEKVAGASMRSTPRRFVEDVRRTRRQDAEWLSKISLRQKMSWTRVRRGSQCNSMAGTACAALVSGIEIVSRQVGVT